MDSVVLMELVSGNVHGTELSALQVNMVDICTEFAWTASKKRLKWEQIIKQKDIVLKCDKTYMGEMRAYVLYKPVSNKGPNKYCWIHGNIKIIQYLNSNTSVIVYIDQPQH